MSLQPPGSTVGGSPVSDGGRGLKLEYGSVIHGELVFARQRWRAWIETWTCPGWSWARTVRPSAMAGVD